jgi:hypothetical protein
VFAIFTAKYARKAFLKQSEDIKDQAELIEVQSRQLELQRLQFEEQRNVNVEQIRVLKLQAVELEESLAVRKREEAQRRSAQAARVFLSQSPGGVAFEHEEDDELAFARFDLVIKNTSDRPVYDARLHWYVGDVEEDDSFGFGEPVGTMMPGDEITRFRQFAPSVDRDASRPVLRFRDAARVMWQVDKSGDLRELPPLAS